jgi:hypothetical protein
MKEFKIYKQKIPHDLIDTFIILDTINSIKFKHETRWYMEKKSILSELRLS